MWHESIFDLTPVEHIGDLWFKRDDKFAPDGVHNGSKFRQLIWLFSRGVYPGVASGAVTGSPQLPMVASCAQHYGMQCTQFSGARKGTALAGERLGARTIIANPGYGALLNRRAADYAQQHGWLHIETNITTTVDIEPFHAVGAEQVRNIPDNIRTLIIPAGSRNSTVSIIYGLHKYPRNIETIVLLNIAPNLKKKEKWMRERLAACGVHNIAYNIKAFDVFENNYTNYSKLMPFSYSGLRFHSRYEGKCWNYMTDNLSTFQPYLNERALFWIVASDTTDQRGRRAMNTSESN